MFVWWIFNLPQPSGLNGVCLFSQDNDLRGASVSWHMATRGTLDFHSIASTLQTGTANAFVQLPPPDCAGDAVPTLDSTGNEMLR
jgi:hypothetical protein